MKSIKIYVEGGGDTVAQQAQIRNGMEELLKIQKELAQEKRIKWKLIPRGGRDQTFEAFNNAFRQADDETLVVLLVDSEEAISPEVNDDPDRNAKMRKDFLLHRDASWDLKGIPPRANPSDGSVHGGLDRCRPRSGGWFLWPGLSCQGSTGTAQSGRRTQTRRLRQTREGHAQLPGKGSMARSNMLASYWR